MAAIFMMEMSRYQSRVYRLFQMMSANETFWLEIKADGDDVQKSWVLNPSYRQQIVTRRCLFLRLGRL